MQLDDLISVVKKAGVMNEISIEILEDGTLRVETGAFDSVVHVQADKILKDTEKYMGGTSRKTASKLRKHHAHTHVHQGHTH